jgi:hypothetical protein
MTVIARSKLAAGKTTRHREPRWGRSAQRGDAPGFSEPVRTTAAVGGRASRATYTATRRRREAGAPQDQAVYSCSCGFVFEAQVSTSVGCPHCGSTQAW